MLLVRFLCGRFGFNTSVYAVVMTALPVLVSGGIHTDGFIDTVDALSSYGDKEKKLEILKDPHTGAFAIIGAVMYYLLFFGFMTEIWDIKATIAVSVGFVLSRSLSGLAIGIFNVQKTADFFTHLRVPHTKNDCDCYDFVYCFVRCDALFYGRVRTGYDMCGGDFVFVVQTRCIQ